MGARPAAHHPGRLRRLHGRVGAGIFGPARAGRDRRGVGLPDPDRHAHRVGQRLPHRAAGLHLADQGASEDPAKAARRRVRPVQPDPHGRRALAPRGAEGGAPDHPLGRAPGVSRPPGRAPDRRSAESGDAGTDEAPRVGAGAPGRDRRAPAHASGALRGRAQRLRVDRRLEGHGPPRATRATRRHVRRGRRVAPRHRRRRGGRRPHGRVPRGRGPRAAGRRPRRRRTGPARGGRGRGQARRHARAPALPPARVDVPGGGHLVRAQDLRDPLPRVEQGHEPQQLHRAHGRPLSRLRHGRRQDPPPGERRSVRPRHPRPRLRPHARRRQHAAAGVLPAPRRLHAATREREDRGRADAVLGVPRRAHPAGAHRRRHHRRPAHRPPGDDPLRGDLLGGGERGAAQGRAGRHHGRGGARGLHRPAVHPEPHADRGQRVERSTCASAAGSSTTTPSGSATAPRRPTSARCASSASGGRTAASSSCRRSSG